MSFLQQINTVPIASDAQRLAPASAAPPAPAEASDDDESDPFHELRKAYPGSTPPPIDVYGEYMRKRAAQAIDRLKASFGGMPPLGGDAASGNDPDDAELGARLYAADGDDAPPAPLSAEDEALREYEIDEGGSVLGADHCDVEEVLGRRSVFRRIARVWEAIDRKLVAKFGRTSPEYVAAYAAEQKRRLPIIVNAIMTHANVSSTCKVGRAWFRKLECQFMQKNFMLNIPHPTECDTKYMPSAFAAYHTAKLKDLDEIHRAGSLSAANEIVQLATRAVFRYTTGQRPYVLLAGEKSTGKSQLLTNAEKTLFPGVVSKNTTATAKAGLDGQDEDYTVLIFEELPRDMAGTDRYGKRVQAEGHLKDRMTNTIVKVDTINVEDGKRVHVQSVSSKIQTVIAATNDVLPPPDDPLLARWILIHVGRHHADEDPITKKQIRHEHAKRPHLHAQIELNMQIMSFWIFVVERCIQAHALTDVNMSAYDDYTDIFFDALQARYGVNTNLPKLRNNLKTLARTATIEYAIHVALFSEIGSQTRLDPEKMRGHTGIPTVDMYKRLETHPELLRDIEPFLVCTKEIALHTFTLLSFTYVDSLQCDILACVRRFIQEKGTRGLDSASLRASLTPGPDTMMPAPPPGWRFRPAPEKRRSDAAESPLLDASYFELPHTGAKNGIDGVAQWLQDSIPSRPKLAEVKRQLHAMARAAAKMNRVRLNPDTGEIETIDGEFDDLNMVIDNAAVDTGIFAQSLDISSALQRPAGGGGGGGSGEYRMRRAGRGGLAAAERIYVSTALVMLQTDPQTMLCSVIESLGHCSQPESTEWIMTGFPSRLPINGRQVACYTVPHVVAIRANPDRYLYRHNAHAVDPILIANHYHGTTERALHGGLADLRNEYAQRAELARITIDSDSYACQAHAHNAAINDFEMYTFPPKLRQAFARIHAENSELYDGHCELYVYPDDLMRNERHKHLGRSLISGEQRGDVSPHITDGLYATTTDQMGSTIGFREHVTIPADIEAMMRAEKRTRSDGQVLSLWDIAQESVQAKASSRLRSDGQVRVAVYTSDGTKTKKRATMPANTAALLDKLTGITDDDDASVAECSAAQSATASRLPPALAARSAAASWCPTRSNGSALAVDSVWERVSRETETYSRSVYKSVRHRVRTHMKPGDIDESLLVADEAAVGEK